ncbi:MAG: hypothetical protein R3E66_20365 [bacterium]
MRIVVFMVLALLATSCDSTPKKPEPAAPLDFKSTVAPYTVKLSSPWTLTTADTLNTHADLAATYDDTLYLIVIPQKLPAIPGVDPPDALALKRASLAVLEERLKGFQIARQGPIKIDDEIGQSVFASGETEGQQIQYVATYATRGDWGFQVVGWGPKDKASLLTAEVDRVLSSWKFLASKPSELPIPSETEDAPDASTD